jgi:hypothetical protein
MQSAVAEEHSHTRVEDNQAYPMEAEPHNYAHTATVEEAVVAVPGIQTLLT